MSRKTSATYHGRYWNKLDEQYSAEARRPAPRLDLDAWLSLPEPERAARWRCWSESARQDAVVQGLERKYGAGEWDAEMVARVVAHYSAKWGSEPTESERAALGALELVAEQAAMAERTAQVMVAQAEAELAEAERAGDRKAALGLVKQRARHQQAQERAGWDLGAARRAQEMFLAGVRPVELTAGQVWTVPSASEQAASYRVELRGGVWDCGCRSKVLRGTCKHIALARALHELAAEHYDDPAPTQAAEPPRPVEPAPVARPAAPARMNTRSSGRDTMPLPPTKTATEHPALDRHTSHPCCDEIPPECYGRDFERDNAAPLWPSPVPQEQRRAAVRRQGRDWRQAA